MNQYKMKPNTTIHKGDTLKLINGMVTVQPVYTRIFPSDFIRRVDCGEIPLDTKWKRHDYKVFKSLLGSRHFIGVAAEYKVSGNESAESILVFDKEGAENNISIQKINTPEKLTEVVYRDLRIVDKSPEAVNPEETVTVKFTEQNK